ALLAGEDIRIHHDGDGGRSDARAGTYAQTGGVARDREGCVVAAGIDDGQSLGGDGAVAEVAAKHQIRLSSGDLVRLRQCAYREHHDAAVGGAVQHGAIARQNALAGEILREIDLALDPQIVRGDDLQYRGAVYCGRGSG